MPKSNDKVLLVVAHGSRQQTSNDQIRQLVARLSAHNDPLYSEILPAFLEFEEPSITMAIGQQVDKGVREIVVLPYFLANGRHVKEDIPAQIRISQAQFPDVNITLAGHLGAAAGMPDLIFKHLLQTASKRGEKQ